MGRRLEFGEISEILKTLALQTTNEERKCDIIGVTRIIESDIQGRNRGHARRLAADPSGLLEIQNRVREMFYEITGIDSEDFDDGLPPQETGL